MSGNNSDATATNSIAYSSTKKYSSNVHAVMLDSPNSYHQKWTIALNMNTVHAKWIGSMRSRPGCWTKRVNPLTRRARLNPSTMPTMMRTCIHTSGGDAALTRTSIAPADAKFPNCSAAL